ncbi:MAG: hypothetical protein IBX45_09200 [Campylobacterales bacterium]|nr:hypothetical protein [Campylobacterales bacterium]
MALKTLYAFLGTMVSIALFLMTQEQYSFAFKPQDPTVANMVMHGVQNYEISTLGVESITNAKTLKRFTKYDELYAVETLMRGELHVSLLRANEATITDAMAYLKGDVYFARSDEVSFESEEAIYHREAKILEGNLPFLAMYGPHQSKGKSFVYNMNDKTLEATHVDALLETEKQ